MKQRIEPRARRLEVSMQKPACSTASSVFRLGWQPPETVVQRGWARSCSRATGAHAERTCSNILSLPFAARTRCTSDRPAAGSMTEQKTRLLTTVWKVAGLNGRLSAQATTSGRSGARPRARCAMRNSSSSPTTSACSANNSRFRPVPHPKSRVRPEAPSTTQRRQCRNPAASINAM